MTPENKKLLEEMASPAYHSWDLRKGPTTMEEFEDHIQAALRVLVERYLDHIPDDDVATAIKRTTDLALAIKDITEADDEG